MDKHIYVDWKGKVRLKWLPHTNMNQDFFGKITSVHAYCFWEGKVLLVKVKNRGFNVPGGHIEFNENPAQALKREVYEEGYVTGNERYIGAIEVNHQDNKNFIKDGPYPEVGYQLFYRVDIEQILPFLRKYETLTRIWVEPEEVKYVINDHELLPIILDAALKINDTTG